MAPENLGAPDRPGPGARSGRAAAARARQARGVRPVPLRRPGGGGPDAIFAGAIYEAEREAALRFHARFHIHGHTVGGTNPVAGRGAGGRLADPRPRQPVQPVGGGAAGAVLRRRDRAAAGHPGPGAGRAAPSRRHWARRSCRRHAEAFTWRGIFDAYERVLRRQLAPERAGRPAPRAARREHGPA
ncbi:hypothetical protein ACU4GA_15785 [Methylobacterium oryzae CBMB20]